MHCVSSYPANPKDLNLRAINTIRERYKCLVGYSGHETTANIAPSVVLYNACAIERHFTLDRLGKIIKKKIKFEKNEMYKREIKYLLNCIKKKIKPKPDLKDSKYIIYELIFLTLLKIIASLYSCGYQLIYQANNNQVL